MGKAGWLGSVLSSSPTIKPGYRYSFEENEVEKAHPAGGVVIKQLEDIQASLESFRTSL